LKYFWLQAEVEAEAFLVVLTELVAAVVVVVLLKETLP
jgi:hypothetical protein